jgi:hypothetical protein
LLSEVEWRRAARGAEAPLWREHFSGELRGFKARTPVVFAERTPRLESAPSASASGTGGLSQ